MSKPEAPSLAFAHHVRETCLCLGTQRAARALARIFDDALRPVGITSGQFSLLMTMARPEPQTYANVSSILGMDRTTLTANLKPLERRGLVKIIVDRKDKRARLLTLTSEGRAVLAKAAPIWKKTHAMVEVRVTHASPDALRADLDALCA